MGRYCSQACFYVACPRGPRKATVKDQRMTTARDHPIAPPGGVVAVARINLYAKIGPGEHPCHWCQSPLRWIAGGGPGTPGSLLADHLDWDRNNDDPSNLVPSCNPCNSFRTRLGDRRRIEPGELTMLWGGKLTRAVKQTCLQCEQAFLTIPAEVKVGKGRFCSRECHYASRSAPS